MTVQIKKIQKGEYEAWKITPHDDGRTNTFDPINTAHISEPIPYGQSVDAWAAELDYNELEAALLIFTDRWTWDEGTPEDKVCLEAIERERERREEQQNWLHAGSHTHSIAVHGAPPVNPVEGMMHVGANGQVQVFAAGRWCAVTISSQNTPQPAHSHGSHSHTIAGASGHAHPKPPKSSP